jgi:hypothetical protein
MKQQKIIFKVLMLLTLVLTFYNCEKDTIVEVNDEAITENIHQELLFSSRFVYDNVIQNDLLLTDALRKFSDRRTSSFSENVNNSQYVFTINTEVAKYAEKTDGSLYSYTFRVHSENDDVNILKNLVVSVNTETSEVNTVLITYHFSETQRKEFLYTGHVSTPYNKTVESLEGDFSDILPENVVPIPCTFDVTVYHITPDTGETFILEDGDTCQHINHETGDSECEVYIYIHVDCPDGSGSNGDGTDGTGTNPITPPSNTSGGTLNDTRDDSDVLTTPILTPSQVISDCMNGNSFNPRLSETVLTWLEENKLATLPITEYLKNIGCNEEAMDFIEDAIEAMMGDPNLTFEDYIRERVEEILEDRPFGIIEVPCSELEKWQVLALHNPPPSVINRVHAIDNQDTTYFTDYSIQTIENAQGHLVNMDYFPVEITSFPVNPSTNLPYTPEEFLTYFRLNINSFVDNSWAVFEPVVYQNGSFSIDDTNLWNSNNPLTVLLTLDIPIDEGTVMVSDYSDSNFTVITLETPWDSEHPVSGVRDFGFTQTNSGSYVFYTRAVDRMADGLDYAIASTPIPNDVAFFGSDALWESFQEKLSTFVNLNGGSAEINFKETYRPTWEKIKKVLRGEISIDELDCLN